MRLLAPLRLSAPLEALYPPLMLRGSHLPPPSQPPLRGSRP
uniref:Uncharacterized protein n=1 Tax=Solanum lycopersicum TaxID=4081 RepID=A0A3Q7I4J5_SOLLC